MEKMLTEVCTYLNNFFAKEKKTGTFTISDGRIVGLSLLNGQYFRIIGSILNDGVYKFPVEDLKDEVFEGSIWSMAVPQTVIDLTSEIETWQTKNGSATSLAMSPFTSESFNNYSYSKSSGGEGTGSKATGTWQSAFANRLNPYRRLRGLP